MKYACRCRHCEKRKTLTMRPERYVRQPKCWNCGRRSWRIDKWRRLTEHRRYACRCGGLDGVYNWNGPHRCGSKWCHHSTNPPTEQERQALWATRVKP